MTTLDALGVRLVAAVPVVVGKTLFLGSDADLPLDTAGFLNVIETGGQSPLGTHNEGPLAETRPWFQITARAADYRVAVALLDKAFLAMVGVNVTWSGVFFLSVRPTTSPFGLPADTVGRARRAFNVATHRRG